MVKYMPMILYRLAADPIGFTIVKALMKSSILKTSSLYFSSLNDSQSF